LTGGLGKRLKLGYRLALGDAGEEALQGRVRLDRLPGVEADGLAGLPLRLGVEERLRGLRGRVGVADEGRQLALDLNPLVEVGPPGAGGGALRARRGGLRLADPAVHEGHVDLDLLAVLHEAHLQAGVLEGAQGLLGQADHAGRQGEPLDLLAEGRERLHARRRRRRRRLRLADGRDLGLDLLLVHAGEDQEELVQVHLALLEVVEQDVVHVLGHRNGSFGLLERFDKGGVLSLVLFDVRPLEPFLEPSRGREEESNLLVAQI